MEIAILIVVVGFIAWWYAGRQKAQRLERQRALETWEHDLSDKTYERLYTVHFPTMRMVFKFEVLDDYVPTQPTEYKLKRSEAGQWKAKQTDACYRRELEDAHADVAKGGLCAEKNLAELQAGNKWTRIGEDLEPAMETAYQRYVRNA